MLEELLLAAVSDPDANAWANAVQGAGGFVTGPQRRRVATLIRSLKVAGVWTTLDRFWLFAAENSTQALIDLKARAQATIIAGGAAPVFTAGRGYKGQSSGYIDSNFNCSTAGGNYARNSGTYGVWVETADTTNTNRLVGNDSSQVSEIAVGAVNLAYGCNQGSASGSNTAIATTGLIVPTRTGALATAFYLNATQQATVSAASIALANGNVFFLAGNNGGAAFQACAARLSLGVIAGGWTAAQEAAFYAPVRVYMTAVGVA